MSRRRQAFRRLEAMLSTAMSKRDLSSLLNPAAVSAMGELVSLLATGGADGGDVDDVMVRYLLGLVHWYRYQALPAGKDHDDLAAAIDMFSLCFAAGVDDFPEQLLTPILS